MWQERHGIADYYIDVGGVGVSERLTRAVFGSRDQ